MKKFVMLALLASAVLTACDAKTNAPSSIVAPTAAKSANADVTISDNWVRANPPGQEVGAAYMTLTSPQDSTLVKVETPAAGTVEIHSMSMENNVMKMRMLEELPLKANTPEKLAPGGFHLMLFYLKKPLNAGENITFTLSFKDAAGKLSKQEAILAIKEAP